jgi:hypothetical protein
MGMEHRTNQIREAKRETEHYKKQFENTMSLVETQKLSIKLLQDELGEEAEFDAEETAQMRSVRRECETRVNNYEDRMAQLQSDMQKEIDKQAHLLKKVTKERDEARGEANELQHSARSLFNEQKRLESQMDCMKNEASRSTKAMDKMQDETIRLRSKFNELQHERSDLKKQHESHIDDEEAEAAERVTVLADLRSLLERRKQQLNDAIAEDRARIQLHSNEVTVTIVSLLRELDEARAGTLTARASEEAARLQITRMMDEQLAQNQTVDALRHSKPRRFYVLVKSNSQGYLHLTLTSLKQEVLLVTLLLCSPCQLLRQECAPGSCMVLGITTLVPRQIRATQNMCVLCLAGMIWIHQDRSHRDRSNSRWAPPHGGRVVSILILT